MSTVDYERISLGLERGDDATAMLRAQIDAAEASLRETGNPGTAAFRLLERDDYLRALTRETARCLKSGDPLALLVVEFDDTLDAATELRLVAQLHELAHDPGDLIGRVEKGFAIALPWINEHELRPLRTTFEGMVRDTIGEGCRIGAIAAVPAGPAEAPTPVLRSLAPRAPLSRANVASMRR